MGVFAVLFIAGTLNAQYSVGFSNLYGGVLADEGRAIDVSPDSFLVVGGRSFSDDGYLHTNQGGSDYWLMQMTTDGDTLWSRSYGGSNNDDVAAVTHSSTGRIAVFGTTRSEGGDVGINPGTVGAWLLTLDAAGNPLSTRVYAGALGEQGTDITPLSDGGYTLLVQSSSPMLEGATNNGNFDFWVARVNTNGATTWAKFYGGEEAEIPARIQRVPGGYIVVGATSSTDGDITFNHGGFDYWVIRLDVEGELMWQRTFGGSGDDFAEDFVVLEDGSMIINGTSNSSDGDKTVSYGMNDVWVVKVDNGGNLVWEKTFGGTDEDSGTKMHLLGSDEIVMLAQTESSDVHLTGNKGGEDAWVVYLNGNGVIQQQMNYGGDEDDFGRAVTSAPGGEVIICGSSLSTNANLPFNGFGGEDLWLLESKIDTVVCAPNNDCFILDIGAGILEVESNGPITCNNGCNILGTQGPAGVGCQGFNGPVSWYKIRTDSETEVMSVFVQSDEFNRPQIAVMQTLNCNQFVTSHCVVGTNGNAELINIEVESDTAYYVVVGDADGLAGDFLICASALNVNFCNKNPQLYVARTSLGSPLSGPYKPDEAITFCYEINVWDELECNGLQGIQPTFGEGWDSTSFNGLGMPVDVDTMLVPFANGEWDWWPVGSVRYNFTNVALGYPGGVALPSGWYFINNDDPLPNDDPDESIGDIVDCDEDSTTWKVCFTLHAPEDCTSNIDLSLSIKSFADGEIGAIVNQACQYDPPLTWNGVVNCCINPFINPIPDLTICSGDTITAFFNSTLDPVFYSWGVTSTANIIGAEAGVGQVLITQLINVGTDPELVTYSVIGSNQFCETDVEEFNVIVLPPPTATMVSLSPDEICAGDSIDLRFDFNGQPPFIAQFSVNGVPQQEFFSELEIAFASFTPTQSGLITFTSFTDAMCRGNTSGAFNVAVNPQPVETITANICESESVVVNGQEYNFPGEYNIVIEGGASNGCDSIVDLTLNVFDEEFTSIVTRICTGDSIVVGTQVYTESGSYIDTLSTVNGCDSVVSLNLEVVNQIVDIRNQVVCAGNSVVFGDEILTESGTYFDTIPVTQSCDSIIVLNLNVLTNMVLTQTVIVPDTGQSSGSISIVVGGSIPPYTFLWSTGDTTQNVENLETDEYSVTVTDFVGCSAVFDFFVVSGIHDPIEGVDAFSLFPNPGNDLGNISLLLETSSQLKNQLELSILDMQGRAVVEKYALDARTGRNIIRLPGVELAAGTYLVALTESTTGRSMVRRLLIQ